MPSLIFKSAKFAPVAFLAWLSRSRSGRMGRKFVRNGLTNRDLTLRGGVGKGLMFNAARANPSMALGRYELPVQMAIAQYLHRGNVFYDIGANVGFFTILAARLVGDTGRVYAFEPSADNVQAIRHNVQLNSFTQVEVWDKAVARTEGRGTLLLTEYSGGHTLSTVERPPGVRAETEVELVSIDTLIDEGRIKPPALVKIDVEGAEIDVLKGMRQTLEHIRPALIYETDDQQQAALRAKQTELRDYILQFGYQLHDLADSYPDIGWKVGHTVAV